jgi:hypothetical protein
MATMSSDYVEVRYTTDPVGLDERLDRLMEALVAAGVPDADIAAKLSTGEVTLSMLSSAEPRSRELTREEGLTLIDERARRFLGMSGEEFRRRYEAGELAEDDDDVQRLAMLLPFGE